MQNANNSRSGRGPDLRIIPIAMRMHTDSDSRVRIQEFLCGPYRTALGPYGMVWSPSSGSNWAANTSYVRVPII
jgi:hypothetical protein